MIGCKRLGRPEGISSILPQQHGRETALARSAQRERLVAWLALYIAPWPWVVQILSARLSRRAANAATSVFHEKKKYILRKRLQQADVL